MLHEIEFLEDTCHGIFEKGENQFIGNVLFGGN